MLEEIDRILEEFDEKFEDALLDGKDHHQWLPTEIKGFIIESLIMFNSKMKETKLDVEIKKSSSNSCGITNKKESDCTIVKPENVSKLYFDF